MVSVILTSYNRPSMLKEAIDSVLAQTYQDFELILLDDNSNEETLKVIEPYLKNPKIVFYQSNISKEDRYKESPYARQINIGLKMAKGELISYLCDDDLYLPDRLEKMVKFLEEHPEAKVVYGRQKMVWENGDIDIRQPDEVLTDPACKVDHSSVMHYKSCIDEVGDWSTEHIQSSDADFFHKLGAKYPFYPLKEITDIHRYHSESIANKNY
jgi:glycosyltransferase involved in cell wall biosynthesis